MQTLFACGPSDNSGSDSGADAKTKTKTKTKTGTGTGTGTGAGMGYLQNMSKKERTVYGLLFSDCRCYIGQSTSPTRRIKQHGFPSSGWDEDFKPVILATLFDNVWETNRLEFAWRWSANLAGWRVYSSAGAYFDNLPEITWPDVKVVGESFKWQFTT